MDITEEMRARAFRENADGVLVDPNGKPLSEYVAEATAMAQEDRERSAGLNRDAIWRRWNAQTRAQRGKKPPEAAEAVGGLDAEKIYARWNAPRPPRRSRAAAE